MTTIYTSHATPENFAPHLTVRPPAGDPTPAPRAIVFQFEIVHASQVHYGPKPTTEFAVIARGTHRLPNADMGTPPAELVTLAEELNAAFAGKVATPDERGLAIRIDDAPGNGRDDEAGVIYPMRRIETVFIGSRRPRSRRQLLATAPTIHAWLDKVNSTADRAVEQTPAELAQAAQQAAKAAARAEAQAESDHRARLDREAFEEMMSDAMQALGTTDRRRAAALCNVAFGISRHPRPDVIADMLAQEDDLAEVAA